ncbi:sigma-70 family RNA polymerase sigma factor [Photobacterium leiognathi]|uniref:sigma-70 family RNA polymerase sigma factor n=1 Tax=Photobacterium leiognathi TaxID=553611 RepID=UPI002981D890|nr:sigma-70 family RNA polymerase sigma factor [Photobacterium leiognathi]
MEEIDTTYQESYQVIEDKSEINPDITQFLPWCDVIASKFKRKHFYNKEIELDDYKNSAVIGLYHALKNYDPSKGEFKAYCFSYMFYELNKLLISSNKYQMKKLNLDIYVDSITDARNLSINDKIYEEVIEKSKVYDLASISIDIDKIFIMLNNLNKEQRIVLIKHYYNYLSFKEISKILCLSPSRVSQIHRDALRKLVNKVN